MGSFVQCPEEILDGPECPVLELGGASPKVRVYEPVRVFACAPALPLGFAGPWPFRPRPPRSARTIPPSTRRGAAGAAPNLQKIVGQADQLPLGRHLLQSS